MYNGNKSWDFFEKSSPYPLCRICCLGNELKVANLKEQSCFYFAVNRHFYAFTADYNDVLKVQKQLFIQMKTIIFNLLEL